MHRPYSTRHFPGRWKARLAGRRPLRRHQRTALFACADKQPFARRCRARRRQRDVDHSTNCSKSPTPSAPRTVERAAAKASSPAASKLRAACPLRQARAALPGRRASPPARPQQQHTMRPPADCYFLPAAKRPAQGVIRCVDGTHGDDVGAATPVLHLLDNANRRVNAGQSSPWVEDGDIEIVAAALHLPRRHSRWNRQRDRRAPFKGPAANPPDAAPRRMPRDAAGSTDMPACLLATGQRRSVAMMTRPLADRARALRPRQRRPADLRRTRRLVFVVVQAAV